MLLKMLVCVCLVVSFATVAKAQTLEPARLPGMCLTIDPREGSVSRPCDSASGQEFELPQDAPGPIRISGQCLAPQGGGYYPPLFGEACDGSPAQTWTITSEGAVINGAGRCLTVLGNSSRDGERIFGSECSDTRSAHTWRVIPDDRYDYTPQSGRVRWRVDPSLCLTWIQSGSFVGLAACGATSEGEQIFSFDRTHMGQVRARSSCLTSSAGFGSVRLADCYEDPSKTWMPLEGAMLFNGNALCVEPKREGERWIARMSTCTAEAEQRWTFEASSDS